MDGALDTIRHHVGSLDVRGGVAGAAVRVNGEPVGTLPLPRPVRVEAGTVTLQVVAPGYHDVDRSVAISAGGLARETVVLVPAAAPDARTPDAPTPRASETVSPPPTAPVVSAQSASSDPGRTLRTAGWALVGIGAGLAVAGIAADVVWVIEGGGECSHGGTVCPGTPAASATAGELAIAGYVVGGVVGITGLVFVLVAPRPHRERVATRPGAWCGPGPGAIGLACGARF